MKTYLKYSPEIALIFSSVAKYIAVCAPITGVFINTNMHGNMMSFVENARMIGDFRMCLVPRTRPGVKQFTVTDDDVKSFANFLVHKTIAIFECEKASRG